MHARASVSSQAPEGQWSVPWQRHIIHYEPYEGRLRCSPAPYGIQLGRRYEAMTTDLREEEDCTASVTGLLHEQVKDRVLSRATHATTGPAGVPHGQVKDLAASRATHDAFSDHPRGRASAPFQVEQREQVTDL